MIFSLRNKLSIIIICLSITAIIILPHQINDGGSSFFGGAQLIPNLTLSLIIILSFVDLVINGFFSFIKKKVHNFLISNGVSFGFYDFLAVLLITIAFVTFALALPFLGYLITSFFLILFLFLINGGNNIFKLAILSAISVIFMYCTMRFLFGIYLQTLPDFSLI
jgi:hypothetical protein